MLAFWTGLYVARKLHEPAIEEVTQKHYECAYLKEQTTAANIRNRALYESCTLSLQDTRYMLATCNRVLNFADQKTGPEPKPPKRRRWRAKR
jgi:hypothetical protein